MRRVEESVGIGGGVRGWSRVSPAPVPPGRFVPESIVRPPYALPGRRPPSSHPAPEVFDAAGQARMRRAGQLVSEALQLVGARVAPGVTTDDLDELVHTFLVEHKAYPSPLKYAGFPKSICTSVNDVVVHGIPDRRPLEDGDVVSVDVSCFLDGVHGDSCRTFLVGDKARADAELVRLVTAAARCLRESIYTVGPTKNIAEIGTVVQDICDAERYGTINQFFGHGIGSHFHTLPLIKHFVNDDFFKPSPGMCFTIEPMILDSPNTRLGVWDDRWTAISLQGARSAQFEHTVLITHDGYEVLTAYPDWETKPF
jgi:methionyl aminopeptidase